MIIADFQLPIADLTKIGNRQLAISSGEIYE